MILEAVRQPTIRHWQVPYQAGACGDLLIIREEDDAIRLVLVDACGHGPSAAETAQHFRRIIEPDLCSPVTQKAFCHWNETLEAMLPMTSFVAVTVIEFYYHRNVMRIWNAGNPAPIWIDTTVGELASIETYGLPLGAFDSAIYEPPNCHEITMENGVGILVLSDGVMDQCRAGVCSEVNPIDEILSSALRLGHDPLQVLSRATRRSVASHEIVDD